MADLPAQVHPYAFAEAHHGYVGESFDEETVVDHPTTIVRNDNMTIGSLTFDVGDDGGGAMFDDNKTMVEEEVVNLKEDLEAAHEEATAYPNSTVAEDESVFMEDSATIATPNQVGSTISETREVSKPPHPCLRFFVAILGLAGLICASYACLSCEFILFEPSESNAISLRNGTQVDVTHDFDLAVPFDIASSAYVGLFRFHITEVVALDDNDESMLPEVPAGMTIFDDVCVAYSRKVFHVKGQYLTLVAQIASLVAPMLGVGALWSRFWFMDSPRSWQCASLVWFLALGLQGSTFFLILDFANVCFASDGHCRLQAGGWASVLACICFALGFLLTLTCPTRTVQSFYISRSSASNAGMAPSNGGANNRGRIVIHDEHHYHHHHHQSPKKCDDDAKSWPFQACVGVIEDPHDKMADTYVAEGSNNASKSDQQASHSTSSTSSKVGRRSSQSTKVSKKTRRQLSVIGTDDEMDIFEDGGDTDEDEFLDMDSKPAARNISMGRRSSGDDEDGGTEERTKKWNNLNVSPVAGLGFKSDAKAGKDGNINKLDSDKVKHENQPVGTGNDTWGAVARELGRKTNRMNDEDGPLQHPSWLGYQQ